MGRERKQMAKKRVTLTFSQQLIKEPVIFRMAKREQQDKSIGY